MAKVKAVIAKVSAREVNGVQKVLIEMANNDQLWVNMAYVNKLLDSMFLSGARPTAIKGAVVSYEKRTHKAGDTVLDKDGKAVVPAITYSKDGYSLLNFQVEEEGEAAEKFGDMLDKANVKQSLRNKFSGFSAAKPVKANAEVAVNEEEEATTDADVNVA